MTTKGTKDSGRGLRVRVRTKGLKASSTRWLERQLNDPYVADAKRKGYRSRAAFKLIEIDDKFHILKKNATVLDLGAAPGGWSQVARQRVGAGGRGHPHLPAAGGGDAGPHRAAAPRELSTDTGFAGKA